MTAVADGGRTDLDVLDSFDDVEDVALRVAFSESFSFAPILVDDAPPVQSRRRARVRARKRERRLPQLRLPRLHVHLPKVRRPTVHLPKVRRRPRVRRYPIDPIFLEGPRRVPLEVLDLTPSVAVDLRMSSGTRAR